MITILAPLEELEGFRNSHLGRLFVLGGRTNDGEVQALDHVYALNLDTYVWCVVCSHSSSSWPEMAHFYQGRCYLRVESRLRGHCSGRRHRKAALFGSLGALWTGASLTASSRSRSTHLSGRSSPHLLGTFALFTLLFISLLIHLERTSRRRGRRTRRRCSGSTFLLLRVTRPRCAPNTNPIHWALIPRVCLGLPPHCGRL